MTRTKSHFQDNEPVLEKFLQRLRFRKVFNNVKDGSNVLDIGCGYNGDLLKLLSPKINEGMGIDISVTKKAVAKNIKLFSQRKNKKISLPKNYFDLAICLAVIEHLEDPETILKTAYKSMKNGGALILTTPSPAAKPILEFLAFKLGVISKQEIKDHKQYYNQKDIKTLLSRVGFKSAAIDIEPFSLGFNIMAVAKK